MERNCQYIIILYCLSEVGPDGKIFGSCARSERPDLEPNIFLSGPSTQSISAYYYMASSVSRQDDPNRAPRLATRAGKMEPSCPLGTTRCIPRAKLPRKPHNKSFIDQVCSVKMTGYSPRSFFCEFMDLDFVSVHKHAKKRTWPISSHLDLTLGQ